MSQLYVGTFTSKTIPQNTLGCKNKDHTFKMFSTISFLDYAE